MESVSLLSGLISQFSAIPGVGSPLASETVRPSKMLIKIALDVVSSASPGCKDGGSEGIAKLSCLVFEPESFVPSEDEELSESSPPKPHAASTNEKTARTVNNKNFLF